MKQSREWTCGVQRSWFEPPDILWQRFRGVAALEETRWSVEVYRQVATHGPFYAAIDVTGSELTSESRKFLVDNVRTEWLRGVVYVGAGLIQRAVSKGLMLTYLFDKRPHYEVAFANSLDEARHWIERQRTQRKAG
ncbi:hypothetical protein JY651_05840 [Pyxidicoccus parkwayensis]|uniref:STAS/SEC14 domain-containing protein n=1 Tax=Pyxidicoccus parkwayensis TaxID=2813578 RepID=A0ABX7P2M7_9BACT|nr:hypothetical protein [Pyxidicoccus parkwaysis]QSQ24473.1 hypothetical protein JY651_05840 [Pyxidicoccus parkwaysis]